MEETKEIRHWKTCRLGDVVFITSGDSPNKFDLKHEGKFPYFKVEDLNYSNKYQFFSRNYTNNDLKKKTVVKNSIIFPKRGAAILNNKVRINSVEACMDSNMMGITIISNSVHFEFLYYLICNEKLSRIADSSTIPQINNKHIIPYKILLPPLPEQKKIADILSTWDNAIHQTQALIQQLEGRKKGLMQQLLTGKQRLPGFIGQWVEKKLGDITKRITKKNTELNDTVVTISAQRGFVKQEDFFKKRVASNTLSGYFLIDKGDFAYNKSYSKGYPMGAFKRLDNFEKAVVTTLYICFSIKKSANSNFLVYYFEGGMLINGLMKIAQEGGRAHGLLNIGLGDFFGLKVNLPSLPEQTAIAKVLTAAENEIKHYNTYLAQLESQKKGLMQELLTGKTRVSVN